MTEFKIGDRVRCLKTLHSVGGAFQDEITEGAIRTIAGFADDSDIVLDSDKDTECGWSSDLFELVTEPIKDEYGLIRLGDIPKDEIKRGEWEVYNWVSWGPLSYRIDAYDQGYKAGSLFCRSENSKVLARRIQCVKLNVTLTVRLMDGVYEIWDGENWDQIEDPALETAFQRALEENEE
jgi:hypothetical protein